MDKPSENFVEALKVKGIKPSYARIRIYEHLANSRKHPTVEEIYNELIREIPTLSKTTVYNTLGLLIDALLAKVVTIEDNETRYDAVLSNHGHFKCEACGKIFDFDINIDEFSTKGLSGFNIKEKNVYFKGFCMECLDNNTTTK